MTEFEQHYYRYKYDMYKTARCQGASHTRAQDSVQEAAYKLSEMTTIQYIDQRRVRGLFCEVVKNCAIDKLRQDGVYEEKIGQSWAMSKQHTPKREREIQVSIVVHRALAQLSEIESYIAWRYWAVEESVKEIIEDLARDKGQVWYSNKLIRFVRKLEPKLRAILVREGGEKI